MPPFSSVCTVALTVLLSLLSAGPLHAKVTAYVEVQTVPALQVTLTWDNQGTNTVEVVRRPLGQLGVDTWTVLEEDATSPFVDTGVELGESY
ncbi:MAG: hypothetical protein ACQKBT_08290, partial [Puniceicoccales bacterium]